MVIRTGSAGRPWPAGDDLAQARSLHHKHRDGRNVSYPRYVGCEGRCYRAKSVAKCELSAFAGSDLVMHCGLPPRPWLLGFRRPLARTPEPDYSPATMFSGK